jgi:hypothetical protein
MESSITYSPDKFLAKSSTTLLRLPGSMALSLVRFSSSNGEADLSSLLSTNMISTWTTSIITGGTRKYVLCPNGIVWSWLSHDGNDIVLRRLFNLFS